MTAATLVQRLWERFEARDFRVAATLFHEDFVPDAHQIREHMRGRENLTTVEAS